MTSTDAATERPLRVLLADDAPDIVTILRAWLEADDRFEVCGEADTLERAVRDAVDRAADVVVLDWSMPPGRGDVTDAAVAVRRIVAQRPGRRVVVLSGTSDPAVTSAALDAGATRHLPKGTPLSSLTQALLAPPAATPPARVPEGGAAVPRHLVPAKAPSGGVAGTWDADALHDVRTPLTALQGYAAVLPSAAARGDEALLAHAADGVRRNVLRLTLLLDALALEAEVMTGRLSVRPEAVDAARTVQEVLTHLEPLLARHRVTADAPPGALVEADPDRLRSLVTQLLLHAVRTGPPDSAVALELGPGGADAVVLRCTDHGPGLPPELVTQALQRRSRLTRNQGGLGLELFLADALARAQGGRLQAVREDGTTTWVVELPAART
ncbi:response regulator [Egicoccus sp. AB-alg2]|uniref:ATP-binding response regulator n=1 Tax=Egicoccus sp. AB-alg2 TaxID=3242693 RepID=UPI00359EE91B